MKMLDLIWAAIPTEAGATAAELAALTGAKEVQTRRALRVWADAGLLVSEGGGAGVGDARRFRRAPDAPAATPGVTTGGAAIVREAAMSALEFALIRRRLGHSLYSLGRALGWTGKQPSVSRAMKRFEEGGRLIDAQLAAKVRALDHG